MLAGALGCASYQGTARDVSEQALLADAGWHRVLDVELVRQRDSKDCGSAALSTVLRYWKPDGGRAVDREGIEGALRRDPSEGLTAGELRDYARQSGFSAYVIEGAFGDLQHEVDRGRPVIVGVHKPVSSGEALRHYEVFIGYHPETRHVLTLDPANGLRQNGFEGFSEEWQQAGNVMLVVMPSEGSRDSLAPRLVGCSSMRVSRAMVESFEPSSSANKWR